MSQNLGTLPPLSHNVTLCRSYPPPLTYDVIYGCPLSSIDKLAFLLFFMFSWFLQLPISSSVSKISKSSGLKYISKCWNLEFGFKSGALFSYAGASLFVLIAGNNFSVSLFFIFRIYSAKSRAYTPKRQRCLCSALSSSTFLFLIKSVTWFFRDCCGLPLLLLQCGVHR